MHSVISTLGRSTSKRLAAFFFLMKEICLVTTLYSQLIKITALYCSLYILFGRQKMFAL